jgi:hypothetical protein
LAPSRSSPKPRNAFVRRAVRPRRDAARPTVGPRAERFARLGARLSKAKALERTQARALGLGGFRDASARKGGRAFKRARARKRTAP